MKGGHTNENSNQTVRQKKIEALVKRDMQEWPPVCAGWMYQPKRPCVPEKHLQEKRK